MYQRKCLYIKISVYVAKKDSQMIINFGSTYPCKQIFSKLNITKSYYRAKLADQNLSMQ